MADVEPFRIAIPEEALGDLHALGVDPIEDHVGALLVVIPRVRHERNVRA